MNIYFLSTALCDEVFKDIADNCVSFKPTFSGVGFDRNVAKGLADFADIKAVSLSPVPSYPKYKKIISDSYVSDFDGIEITAPKLIALPIVKEICYFFAVRKYVKNNFKKDTDNAVVISGLYRSLLRAANWIKKKYGVKICAIVPDMPELMISYRKDYSPIRKLLNKIDVYNSARYRKYVDGYVFLSNYLDETINVNRKASVIVDGLCDTDKFPDKAEKNNFILYAGKISSKFGVDKLVEAFLNARLDSEAELILCGDGDYAEELRSICRINKHIKYLGLVSHNEVLRLEMSAQLLVDPRPSGMEISKMSFPSKVIEYMASGTPLLVTNLPSFSDEYKQYQYRIDDESVDGIKKSIEFVMNKSPEERMEQGKKAKQFILENKTISVQCRNIMKLIERVNKK